MELWKMPQLGITSEDFMRGTGENETRAFYGSLWKFADDKRGNVVAQANTEKKQNAQQKAAIGQKPLQNALVDEAVAMGQPVAMPDQAFTDAHLNAQKEANETMAANQEALLNPTEPEAPAESGAQWSKSKLMGMPKDNLAQLASSLGVANLDQSKQKLVEAILAKQVS